jgi:hypothetical protein
MKTIRIQVCCTLIAQTKKAFSVVASLVRIHLISMLDVSERHPVVFI